MMFAWFLH